MSYYGLYGVMLISAVMLMISADAVLADNDFAMTFPDPKVSQHATFDPPSPNDSRRKHHMRTHAEIMADDEGDSDEDRAFEGIRASITKGKDLLQRVMNKMKKFIGAIKSKIMPTKRQRIREYFVRSLPEDVKTLELGTQDFQEWERYAHRVYSKRPDDADVAMVETMTNYLGDARLMQMLLEAEKVPQTNVVAIRLIEAQFRYWLSMKKNADDAFMMLRLFDKKNILLTDSMVMAWISYVGKCDEEGQLRLVWSVLMAHFKEEALAKMIFAAKNDKYMKDIAQKFEAMQLGSWLKSDTPIDKVYRLLNVHLENGNPFEEPGFNIWASYVMLTEPEKSHEILMVELKARYNDDRALAELLAAEKTRDGLISIEHLENLQYLVWFDQQKTADDIFTLLELHKRGNMIFEDKLWHTWVSYLAELAKQTGERQEALMYSVLKKYNKRGMMNLIDIARKNRDTEPIAATLLSEKWQDEQKSGIGTFKDWLWSYLP